MARRPTSAPSAAPPRTRASDGDDADGDSFSTPADCDDNDAAVSPAQPEVSCNGLDDDCDPATNDSPDADADAVALCDRDCDDADPERSPLLVELTCNSRDDDCDEADDDDVDADLDRVSVCDGDCDDDNPAGGALVDVYFDGDLDDYGVGAPTTFCVPPNNASEVAGDCDDRDPAAYPCATATRRARKTPPTTGSTKTAPAKTCRRC